MNQTTEQARQQFRYSPDTGVVYRRKWDRPVTGLSCKGYLHAVLNGKLVFAHRIAWMCAHGDIPDGAVIDHINRDKTDNRLCNLRLCTPQQNQTNTGARNHSKSGIVGVHRQVVQYKRFGGRCKVWWVAQAQHKGVQHNLGRYSTPEEARKAYLLFKLSVDPAFSACNLFC